MFLNAAASCDVLIKQEVLGRYSVVVDVLQGITVQCCKQIQIV